MGIIIIWIICGFVTAVIAAGKGRSGFGWLLVGLLLGIFGVILIACMPSLKPQQVAIASAQQAIDSRPTRRCPECAETILMEAKVCKHCGHRAAA